jgi:hypothetical protein
MQIEKGCEQVYGNGFMVKMDMVLKAYGTSMAR